MWTGKEIANALNVPPRLLIDLSARGFIHPAIDATGCGSTRKYDRENICHIQIFIAHKKCMPYRFIGRVLAEIRNQNLLNKRLVLYSFLEDGSLKIKGYDYTPWTDEQAFDDLFKYFEGIFCIIPLEEIRSRTEKIIKILEEDNAHETNGR